MKLLLFVLAIAALILGPALLDVANAQSATPALAWNVPRVTGIWQSTNYDPGTNYLWNLFNCSAWQANGEDDENTAAVFGLPAGTPVYGIRFKGFASSGSGPTTIYHSTLWLRDTNSRVLTDPKFGNTGGRVLETALYRSDNDSPQPGFGPDGVQANHDFPPFGQATVTVTDPRTGATKSTVQAGGIGGWQWDMGWQIWTPVQIVFAQPHTMQGHLRFENLDIGSFNVVGNYGVRLLMPTSVPHAC
jgi:hypothetical protein